MKILGIIPARGGSKGIPGKNIKSLGGKPLLHYTFEHAKASELLSRVILSSDDPKIASVAKELGLEVPFTRPSELAEDNTSSLAVIQHTLAFFSKRGDFFDAICLLQPTSPFREPGLIDKAIKKFTAGSFDSLVSVREVPADYNPHWTFEDQNGRLKIATGDTEIISRRQDLPKAYHRDGAVYLAKTSVTIEQNSLFGRRIGYIDTTNSPHVNIDTPADWKAAEQILKQK